MPTGYTATLCEKDQPFEEFVMQCAKAMGACVMMRDEPFDAPIPKRMEPSDYHSNKLAELKEKADMLENLSGEECETKAEKECQERRKELQKYISKQSETNNRLNTMLALVVEWQEPTPDHVEFKEFMCNQIRISKDDGDYWQNELKALKPMSGTEWAVEQQSKVREELKYHEEKNQEEIERTESRNKWVSDLRESLKGL